MGEPRHPRLGASYVPGGYDDYYMPEVISPLPQRIMPEVPSNIQEGIAHLELEARNQRHQSNTSSIQNPPLERLDQSRGIQKPKDPAYAVDYEHTNASAYQNISKNYPELEMRGKVEAPKFSPFPKVHNPGPNVPMSDEEKEDVLEGARHEVLASTDPEVQLAWAQDALSWVEIASEYALRTKAEGESTRAQTPKVEHNLRVDAMNIVNHLAEQGHPRAEFMRAYWLEFGKFGYRVDKKEAFLGYTRAAEKGYSRAEYRIGMQYENSNNSHKAVEHYQRGVAMRDSASNYRLGMMSLLAQHGMPLDYEHGIELVRFAAETADENAPQGAYVYGMLLARELPNISIPEHYLQFNIDQARMFIEKGAYLGFAKAQLKMGQAYELCQLGCDFDPALSIHYNALASRQGESEADMAISKWFLCGYESIFEKNEELAFTYAKRAATTKMPTAEFAMGYFYEIGIYVDVDLHESEIWYKKAAEHGNTDALARINSVKGNKPLSKDDHAKVAIERIKSQYGSQKGMRPDRFRKKPAPMSALEEGRPNSPDSKKSYGPSAAIRPNLANSRRSYAGASRSESSDARNDNPLPRRPVSTAPYPDDDIQRTGYRQTPRAVSAMGPQSDRPHSAFGIRPPNHASAEYFSQGPSLRPYSELRLSSMGNGPLHSGSSGQVVATGWDPERPSGYRGTLNSLPVPSQDHSQKGPGPSKIQKPHPFQTLNRPQIPSNAEDHRGWRHVSGSDSAIRFDANGNQHSRPERTSSSNPQPSPQSPSSASQRPIIQNISSQQSQLQKQDLRVDSKPAPLLPSVTSPTTGPKRAGPATFEEMGIPVASKEGDCRVM